MILVSGTKRSGTSMWMQVLAAAGFPVVGEAFPERFGPRLDAANPRGFYESKLRQGIHHGTNPDPDTGAYLHPADAIDHVVKVFVPGLVRTDLAFIDAVLVCVREPGAYVRSMARLASLEPSHDEAAGRRRLAADLEWFDELNTVVHDAAVRRYPVEFVTYESVLRDPRAAVSIVLAHVGGGDADRAVAAIAPELRTARVDATWEPSPELVPHRATVERLYQHLDAREPIGPDLLLAMADAYRDVAPTVRAFHAAEDLRRLERELQAMRSEAQP